MDVTASPSSHRSRCHPRRSGVVTNRQAALDQLTLHADETDGRAVMVVESGALAGHP